MDDEAHVTHTEGPPKATRANSRLTRVKRMPYLDLMSETHTQHEGVSAMSTATTTAPVQFTMSDLVKVINADTGGRGGSIRRAMSALSALGIAPVLPAIELSDAELFTGAIAPLHFFAPHDASLSACDGAGKVTRTGRKVTCEACKDIHRAAVAEADAAYAFEDADASEDAS
jgi:hypothetical protein